MADIKNLSAERALLGALMLDGLEGGGGIATLIQRGFCSEWFTDGACANVAAIISKMCAAGRNINLSTVVTALEDAGRLECSGGRRNVETLVDEAVYGESWKDHADAVCACWKRRKIIENLTLLRAKVAEAEDVDGELAVAAQSLASLAYVERKKKSSADILEEIYADMLKAGEEGRGFQGYELRLPTLTYAMGGFPDKAAYIVVGARPSVGKTMFEQMVAEDVAAELQRRGDNRVIVRITMDMTEKRLMARSVASMAGVSISKMKAGYASKSERNKASIRESFPVLGAFPWVFVEGETYVENMMSIINSWHARRGVAMITIDYIQQIYSRHKTGSRSEEITRISNTFKSWGVKNDVPILALAQFSREGDKAERAPKLSDLRDCGSLEQDATIALLLFQDKAALRELGPGFEPHKKMPVVLNVAKNQDGESPLYVYLWRIGEYFKFQHRDPNAPKEELLS